YLLETNGETRLRSEGLASGGVKLSFDASVAKVNAAGDITPNPQFDLFTRSVGSGTATLNVEQLTSSPVTAPSSRAAADRLLLGPFRSTGVSAGTTLALTSDPDPRVGVDDTVTGGGTALDSVIQNNSATIAVANVPEPGSLTLCGLA